MNIIISTAEKSLKSKLSNVVKSNTKKYILYDSNCQNLKREFRRNRRAFLQNTDSHNKRMEFHIARLRFKRAVKNLKRRNKEKELNMLQNLEKKDPKIFWKGVRSLVASKKPELPTLNSNQWLTHFKKL